MIVITEAGNATFKVIQWDISRLRNPSQAQVVLREELFLVTKQVLTDNSRVLRERFESHQSSDKANQTLRTKEDSISSMEIWLRILHNTVTPNTYQVAIAEMWYLAAAAENYQFDITRLKTWFDEWYIHQEPSRLDLRCQKLLFPCWKFDHARGFLHATHEAVYGVTGYIEEDNPTRSSLSRFRLPLRAIQNLNMAKGSIRSLLHAPIYLPLEQLPKAGCSCKDKTVSGYLNALHKTGAWPFDSKWSVQDVTSTLTRLSHFSYQAAPNACMDCRKNYEFIVKTPVQEARYHFDGLCLDCMERSKPRPDSDLNVYLQDNKPTRAEWSRRCRVTHGEPTWYHSFMGLREHRAVILKQLRGRYPKMRTERE